jgi:multiple sugar transport system permease protein/N,N'-diacetylchitobiose transport system permease protein
MTDAAGYLTYFNTFAWGKQGLGAALSFLISLFSIAMAIIFIRWLYRPEEIA